MRHTIPDPRKRLRAHTILSVLTLAIGAVLMTFMVTVESEPGLLPALLVVAGIGWHLITRARIRSLPK